jgi:methylated-DNA-protein-cysteine methyltransferase-like protein
LIARRFGATLAAMDDLPFARVHALVARIPRGRVATYGQLSQLIDRRLTPVGVGWALRAAPAELPWHRVVNGSGGLSTDGHAPGLQRALLESEGHTFDRQGRLDLARVRWRPRTVGRAASRPRPPSPRR